MPWQNQLNNDASKSFAADEKARTGASADPAIGGEICPACPEELVLVEFADKPGSNAAFGGLRAQYVNFSSDKLVGVDPEVKSAHQLGRTPPIVVKVSPPKAKTVTLQLVREGRAHGFPAGSETLSAREAGLSHLTWPVSTATVTTDGKGEGKLDPGMAIPALGGFKFKVEGRIDKKPFVRSGNSVNVRRRLAIRPVVHYATGKAAAFAAMAAIKGDLEALDIESFSTATLTGGEIGVREEPELTKSLVDIGNDALDSPDSVKVFKPHAVAIIVGEFVTDPMTAISFERDVPRTGGNFPASVPIQLAAGGFVQLVVPLTNGSQFDPASNVSFGTPPVEHALQRSEVQGLNQFGQQVTVNISRFLPLIPPTVNTITVSVKLKTISGWAVGWAYNTHPVIYLNMRDPNSNNLLSADAAAALVIHELGHKLHLTSTAASGQPDQQPHHYPTFTSHGVHHQGPHCSTGVPAGTDLWKPEAHNAASCTMWGALKTTRAFCPECRTTLRKVDLSSGF